MIHRPATTSVTSQASLWPSPDCPVTSGTSSLILSTVMDLSFSFRRWRERERKRRERGGGRRKIEGKIGKPKKRRKKKEEKRKTGTLIEKDVVLFCRTL